jgi:hypothetical protein
MIRIRSIFAMVRNVLSIVGLVSVFAGAYLWIAFGGYPRWFADEKEVFRLGSPNSEYDAVVSTQEPGGFGSSIVRLYVVPAGLAFDTRAQEFKHESFRSHTVWVNDLRWEDDRTLLMTRGAEDRIYHFDPVREYLQDSQGHRLPRVIILLRTEVTNKSRIYGVGKNTPASRWRNDR